jgi:glycerophosphoryl diester phosphodiesterase
MPRALQHREASIRVIAHRGARAFAPENTLPAIKKAFALGADMVEVDVHYSRDHELVVIHDHDLFRCTDARARFPNRPSYRVRDFTWPEIAQLDAGSWYLDELRRPPAKRSGAQMMDESERRTFISAGDLAEYGSGEVHPPHLSDCLEVTRAAGRLINVEIKSIPVRYAGIASAVARLIGDMGMSDASIVSSFDHAQLAELRAVSSRISTGVLTRDRLYDPAAYVRRLDADALHVSGEGEDDALADVEGRPDRHLVRSLQDSGFAVHVWTINDPERIRALVEAGVNGVISDFPNRVLRVLKQRNAR